MQRPLHILMPMAGEGSRFFREGWTTPKPLIMLDGVPLFMRAVGSVAMPHSVPLKFSFVVRQEHIDQYHIDEQIKAYLPSAHIFSVEHTTRGAVETCMMAATAIDDDDAVLVMDCDLQFSSLTFTRDIMSILAKSATQVDGGLLVSFTSDNPRYSYAEVDDNMIVKRTAEKKVISSHALCGAYFFSVGSRFKQVARQLLDEPDFAEKEFYVSLLYNYLLKNGETVRLCMLDDYRSYGTPEELKQYM